MTPCGNRLFRAALLGLLLFAACAPRKVAVLPAPPPDIRREPAVAPQTVPVPAPSVPQPAPPDYPRLYREALAASRQALGGAGIPEAIRAWKRLEQSPWAQDAVFNQGVLLHLAGDIGGAEAAYRRITERPPAFAPAAANLLGIHLLRGDRKELRRLAEAFLPSGSLSPSGLPPELAANLAAAFIELGDAARGEAILAYLEKQGALSPAAAWSRVVLSARSGNIADAKRQALKIPPAFADLFPVAASRRAWEAEEAAIPDIEIPATADPRMTALARNLKAFGLYREGRIGDAETFLSGAPGEASFPGETTANIGLLRLAQGKWADARALFERATREHPEVPGGWLDLGIFRDVYEGNAAAAEECYKKYVALNGPKKDEVATWIEKRQGSSSP